MDYRSPEKEDEMKKLIIAMSVLFCLEAHLTGCGNQSYFDTKAATEDETEVIDDAEVVESTKIYVQVSGAVKYPGVYELSSDSRVFQAIESAGGLTEDADDTSLNQASALEDGQKIYVYSFDEVKAMEAEASSENDGRLNLNTASKEELMTLSGIGEAKAEAIVAYREEKGGFSSIEELKNISGIKDGVLSKISDQIYVN